MESPVKKVRIYVQKIHLGRKESFTFEAGDSSAMGIPNLKKLAHGENPRLETRPTRSCQTGRTLPLAFRMQWCKKEVMGCIMHGEPDTPLTKGLREFRRPILHFCVSHAKGGGVTLQGQMPGVELGYLFGWKNPYRLK